MKWRLDRAGDGGAGRRTGKSAGPHRFLRGGPCAGLLVALVLGVLAARASLPEWVRNVEAGSALRDAFFRALSLPYGTVTVERAPKETRAALGSLIGQTPEQADLYALRARESERDLDFVAAEADWKRYAEGVEDPAEGQLALADYYHRRLRPSEEVAALLAVGRSPSPPSEKRVPPQQGRSWQAFERIFAVIEAQALPAGQAIEHYRAWLIRYPGQSFLYQRFFDFLLDRESFEEAERLIKDYQQAFPGDHVFPVKFKASLARKQGAGEQALALYAEAFEPLWPQQLVQEYFLLLQESRQLRRALDRARAALAENPDDLKSTAWIYYYYQRQGNLAAAQDVLFGFRRQKESRRAPWTAAELSTLGQLFLWANNHNEAARSYYALYSLPGAAETEQEEALYRLTDLLLSAPEQPIQLGSGDLSFYRDIATMDDHPGFLNGIFSLLFNSADIQFRFSYQEQLSGPYFRRAKAAELLVLFDQRFPRSERRAPLHVKLLEAYGTYGDSEGVIDAGLKFLAEFPNSSSRAEAALLMADAYARTDQAEKEFATYDSLLKELAEQADGIPLGEVGGPQPIYSSRAWMGTRNQHQYAAVTARSPEYARVLDRYIARLVSLQRPQDALALYARELARNPDDPGLYERLAAFLEQSGYSDRVEQVYQKAIGQFQDRSWHHKLARWYLRRQRTAEFTQLTRGVIGAFSGTDLENYFRDVVNGPGLDDTLYLQVNLFAHERFPQNLTFVHNLLNAYQRDRTKNLAAWERLLGEYWFHDADLRARFFEHRSRTGRLEGELRSIEASLNPGQAAAWNRAARENSAATQYVAEARAWRSHFEEAAPVLLALATERPADSELGTRTAAVHRSLAHEAPLYTDIATAADENLHRYDPRDSGMLAAIGDTWADQERFDRAKPFWEDIPKIEPGKPDGYLEAATIFWDYYLFDDALRLMREGREKLGNPTLYAYEAGAVYENRRQYERAITEYLQGALAGEGSTPARRRLVELSRRPAHRDLIEQATARLVAGQSPGPAAFQLRVEVLEAQQRRADLQALLERLAEETASFELLDRISGLAADRGMETVRAAALQRQIELTNDPVDRMRLRLSLMHLYEAQQNFDAAREAVEEIYTDHPKILGVVRGVVDFQWRRENYDRALAVLEEAAGVSYPELKKQFTFEAARKATEAEQYGRARGLLATLLDGEPFHAEYMTAVADTYARQKDYEQLRKFYEEKIDAIREADLPVAQKTQQTASLRRGLIPALTELGDPAAAVDQYIEIINRYSEDESVVAEAARYADRHGLRQRVIDYYVKTTQESPRDFRYHRVLAWVFTHFENLPAAIEAYGRALQVRPDNTGVVEARANLQTRLLRFEEALESYGELYRLTHEDPQWMERLAEIHARKGERQAAVEALRKARIDGRPARPENYFSAAERLEGWNYLSEAQAVAAEGINLAGDQLLQGWEFGPGLRLYARLAARLRAYEAGYQRLRDAWPAEPNDFTMGQVQSALQEMGSAVDRYFAPEEKVNFAAFLEREKAGLSEEQFEQWLLPTAESAGLADVEARWRQERMMASPGSGPGEAHHRRLAELQRRRARFNELGQQLEAYWRVYPMRAGRQAILDEAAEAYRAAGNVDSEFQALTELGLSANYRNLERYFELLLQRNPERLVELAGDGRAANYAMARGDLDLAQRAVAAFGRRQSPVWNLAYRGLTGLYFGSWNPEIQDSFTAALGPATVGERLGKAIDRNQQLAGDIWFYYGSRYGEYLATAGGEKQQAEDYLPAMVEASPGRASAYFEMAEYYRGQEQLDRALSEYQHALELLPEDGKAHHRMAAILWRQGKRDDAVGSWRKALDAFTNQIKNNRVSATFWDDAPETLGAILSHQLRTELNASVEALMAEYVQRQGGYRVEEMLQPLIEGAADRPAELARWLALADKAASPTGYLSSIADASWLPKDLMGNVLERIVETARRLVAANDGRSRYYAEQELNRWEVRRIERYLAAGEGSKAQQTIQSAPDSLKWELVGQRGALLVRAAAGSGQLEAFLSRYRQELDKQEGSSSPRDLLPGNLEALPEAAAELRKNNDATAARRVLEFYYQRKLEQNDLSASNFLGLAEVRLEQGQPEDALRLLRRMAITDAEPFENLTAAGELLAANGRAAESVEFFGQRVRAAPWDLDAVLRLGRAQSVAHIEIEQAGQRLGALVMGREAPYETRAEAALELARAGGGITASQPSELTVLASLGSDGATVSPTQVSQRYFYRSRLALAARSQNAAERARILREALAVQPDNDKTRFLLFESARAAGDHRLAVAVVEPLLAQTQIAYTLASSDSVLAEQPGQRQVEPWMAEQFLTTQGLTETERSRTAFDLAQSMQALDRLSAAEVLYQVALRIEPGEPETTRTQQALAQLREQVALRTANALRRPVIDSKLEQDRLVRPKLAALP